MAKSTDTTNPSRRNALALIGGASALVAVPAAAAQMSPEERIQHHLRELGAAFEDHFGRPVAVRNNEITPELVQRGGTAVVMIYTLNEDGS